MDSRETLKGKAQRFLRADGLQSSAAVTQGTNEGSPPPPGPAAR